MFRVPTEFFFLDPFNVCSQRKATIFNGMAFSPRYTCTRSWKICCMTTVNSDEQQETL